MGATAWNRRRRLDEEAANAAEQSTSEAGERTEAPVQPDASTQTEQPKVNHDENDGGGDLQISGSQPSAAVNRPSSKRQRANRQDEQS